MSEVLSAGVKRVLCRNIKNRKNSLSVDWVNCCWPYYSPTCFRYDFGSIKSSAFNNYSIVICVFVAAGMSLPSRCLAMIRGYTYRHAGKVS
jgi:hypothetical protein